MTSKRIFIWLALVCVLLFIAHVILQYLNFEVYNEKHGQVFELSNRLDMDDEISVPSWFAQTLLLMAGSVSLLAARLSDGKDLRRLWAGLGIIGIIFSIDEGSGLHELVLQSLHLVVFGLAIPTAQLNAWWLILPFVGAAGSWLLWRIWRMLPGKTFVLFAAGGILFVGGAVGMDLISSGLDRQTFFYQGIATGLEELMELFGTIVIIYATADYLELYHESQLSQAWATLKSRIINK